MKVNNMRLQTVTEQEPSEQLQDSVVVLFYLKLTQRKQDEPCKRLIIYVSFVVSGTFFMFLAHVVPFTTENQNSNCDLCKFAKQKDISFYYSDFQPYCFPDVGGNIF
jgi:hypothetical protein